MTRLVTGYPGNLADLVHAGKIAKPTTGSLVVGQRFDTRVGPENLKGRDYCDQTSQSLRVAGYTDLIVTDNIFAGFRLFCCV